MRDYITLHPFRRRYDANVSYGSTVPTGAASGNNTSNVRSQGLRYPTVLVGWGFDTLGRPIPNDKISLTELNSTADYNTVKYSGGFSVPDGNMVNPKDFIAGPLDVRFDIRSGLWKTDSTFFAEIVNSLPLRNAGFTVPKNLYAWKEIKFPTATGFITYPSGAASGSVTSSYAINTAEIGTFQSLPVATGTIVRMRPARLGSDKSYQLYYEFEYTSHISDFLAIIGTGVTTGSSYKWSYPWYAAIDAGLNTPTIIAGGPSGTQDNSLMALNRWECNNTASLGTFGTQLGVVSGISIIPKIIPAGTPVRMYAEPVSTGIVYRFYAPNDFDIIC